MQTKQPQILRSSCGTTQEVVGGCLPTASVPLPMLMSVEASPHGDSAGSIMSSEKWVPGWEIVPSSGSVCPPHSDTSGSLWSFAIPEPKERHPTDLVQLDLAKRPYHKTSPHGWKGHTALTSHRPSSAFACPPRGPSLRLHRAKGSATRDIFVLFLWQRIQFSI